MIFWVTDNKLSRVIAAAMPDGDVEVKHISKFDDTPADRGIFYGLLRGCTRAMHILKHRGIEFFYIDNGYYDAEYVDKNMFKNMTGSYRFCKSGILTKFTGPTIHGPEVAGDKVLLLKPSAWAANYFDTTPDDWVEYWSSVLFSRGYRIKVRDKSATNSIDEDITKSDMVVSFNSMGVLRAIELGKPTFDTHGILRNAKVLLDKTKVPYLMYDKLDLREFYASRQFKLEDFKKGDHRWIIRESI